MTTTTNQIDQIAQDALDIATEYGARQWVSGSAPMVANDFGGYDFRLEGRETTARITEDDGIVRLYVFTGDAAMLLRDEATFTPGLAHLASAMIAELIR